MRVDVETTNTVIVTGSGGDARNKVAVLVSLPSDATEPVFLEIRNLSGLPTAATVAAGYELGIGLSIGFDLLPGDTLNGIAETATQTVHVLRSG